MKLIDTDETILIITGSDIRAEERDRPVAYELKSEIDRRGQGVAFRRGVVVGDSWYLENRVFHANPMIAVGGPGVNAVSAQIVNDIPTVWGLRNEAYVQCAFEGDQKRAALWGMNTEATAAAVRAFMSERHLDRLLSLIWKFPSEMYA